VTAFNDWSKERQFRGLQNKIDSDQTISVLRDGQIKDLPVKDILVGDICQIFYGHLIPADGIVIESNDLKVDESSLTGETNLIKKSAHEKAMLFSGTHVMEGSGKVLITAVGVHSQTGIIMSLLGATDEKEEENHNVNETEEADSGHKKHPVHRNQSHKKKEQSVLQAKLTRLAIQIGYGGMTIAILTVIVLIIRYCIKGIESLSLDIYRYANKKFIYLNFIKEYAINEKPLTIAILNQLIKFFITGITVLVVAVPEGLPLAVTISLAYAVKVDFLFFLSKIKKFFIRK